MLKFNISNHMKRFLSTALLLIILVVVILVIRSQKTAKKNPPNIQKTTKQGSLYVSDDKSGNIFIVQKNR